MTNGVIDIAAQQAQQAAGIWSNALQAGFASFAVLLLAVLVWVLKQGRQYVREQNLMTTRHTDVLTSLNLSISQNTDVTRAVATEIRAVGVTMNNVVQTVLQSRAGGEPAVRPFVTSKAG